MIGVALMFTGAVLLVNGLSLIGKVDGASIAFFNLVGGALNVGIAIWTGLSDNVFGAGQLFLFAFTYLWLAWNSMTKQADWRAFGWYCGFVALMACPTAALTYADGAPWFGTFWVTWGLLWYLFFVMFALGIKRLDAFAGLSTIAIGVGTAMIPGYLLTSGTWAGG
jgi:hypothetical protein